MQIRNMAWLVMAASSLSWGQQTGTAPSLPAPTVEQAPVAAIPPPKPADAKENVKEKKKGKEVYTGPTNIVEQPATPMLDEEGRQRLDPDGKPMFNAPVKQQRDKKGHPLFDDKHQPVFQTATDLGFDEKGKKIKGKKEKPPKLVKVAITNGTLTIDGMTGKAALNYDIADLKYIYLYAPGLGVTIVSNEPFPGATEQKNGFNDKTLLVTAEGHTLELYSADTRLLGKKPESAFVRLDRDFTLPTKFPVMGYGTLRVPPYGWPGAKETKQVAGAPPLPKSLRPVQLLAPCPAGQMREAARKPLPGETLPDPPCVPIKPKAPTAAATAPTAPPQ
jgi:hypothetical protein